MKLERLTDTNNGNPTKHKLVLENEFDRNCLRQLMLFALHNDHYFRRDSLMIAADSVKMLLSGCTVSEVLFDDEAEYRALTQVMACVALSHKGDPAALAACGALNFSARKFAYDYMRKKDKLDDQEIRLREREQAQRIIKNAERRMQAQMEQEVELMLRGCSPETRKWFEEQEAANRADAQIMQAVDAVTRALQNIAHPPVKVANVVAENDRTTLQEKLCKVFQVQPRIYDSKELEGKDVRVITYTSDEGRITYALESDTGKMYVLNIEVEQETASE